MNRNDGSLDFENKDSTDYAIGFGDVRHNFWKGKVWKLLFIILLHKRIF